MNNFYIGVVEQRTIDPMFMGRMKVRVIGVHSENQVDLPTDDLPWAMPITPLTSASMNGIGESPLGPVEGSYVVVVFLDPDDKQKPIVLGTVPGFPIDVSSGKGFEDPKKQFPRDTHINEPDLNRLARNQKIDQTIVKKKEDTRLKNISLAISKPGSWNQPNIPYSAQYPYNHVTESESGNIVEIDDSPTAQRIHIYHKSGTFTEVDVNGTQVNRIVGNGYEIIDKDGFVYINGNCIINVQNNANIKVGGHTQMECAGSVNIVANDNINVASKKTITLQAQDDIQLACKDLIIQSKSVNMNLSGGFDVIAKENIDMDAPQIYRNSKTAIPKAFNSETWYRFDPDSMNITADPPSRTMNEITVVEGYSASQLQAVGLNPNDPKFQAPKDPATGQPITPTTITPTTAFGVSQIPTAPVSAVDCNNIPVTTMLSTYHQIKDVLFEQSRGQIIGQHGKTGCQIVSNMKKVGANVINPIWNNYGVDKCKLTSFYRQAGNPLSLVNGISRHEIGLAVDVQFNDINGLNSYTTRAKEIADLIYAEKIIVEANSEGSVWLHIQLPMSASV